MPSPKLLTGAAAPARRAIAVPEVPDHLPILGLAPRVNDRIVAAVRQADLSYEPVFAELRMNGANDPSDLPDNIVDRPGRFDRILVFPAPAFDERVRLLERYAASTLEDVDLRRLAAEADGLTGAHLREACRSAEWTLEMDGGEYVDVLGREVAGLRTQQEAATKYGRSLRGERVGF